MLKLIDTTKCWRDTGCMFNSNNSFNYLKCCYEDYSVKECMYDYINSGIDDILTSFDFTKSDKNTLLFLERKIITFLNTTLKEDVKNHIAVYCTFSDNPKIFNVCLEALTEYGDSILNKFTKDDYNEDYNDYDDF